MQVTDEMLIAAVKQAVKDNILPVSGTEEQYLHNWASMRRVLEAALSKAQKAHKHNAQLNGAKHPTDVTWYVLELGKN